MLQLREAPVPIVHFIHYTASKRGVYTRRSFKLNFSDVNYPFEDGCWRRSLMLLLVSLLTAFALIMPTMEVKDGNSSPMKRFVNP
jgi:hypothetical protein